MIINLKIIDISNYLKANTNQSDTSKVSYGEAKILRIVSDDDYRPPLSAYEHEPASDEIEQILESCIAANRDNSANNSSNVEPRETYEDFRPPFSAYQDELSSQEIEQLLQSLTPNKPQFKLLKPHI